jgi:O-6-methylguanine DNA methyltransferase
MSTEFERAFYASDPAYDGRFVAAVHTTGIYCRPSCRGRTPLPKNVSYLPDAATARAAGYRACLRCHPDAATTVVLRSVDTPIGSMMLGATDSALVMAEFAERRMFAAQLAGVRRRFGAVVENGDAPLLDRAEAQLREYFAGDRLAFDLPLDAPGSPFQESVWNELGRIPYGETISYRELARRVGVPAASRAVGRANGSNRLAIVIPCHRVIAAGGGLGGYGGGLEAKRWLLELERGTGSAQRSSRQATSTPTSSYFHTTSTAANPAAISQAR